MTSYKKEYDHATDDPEGFWKERALALSWYKAPDNILSQDEHGIHHWFSDGEMNTAYMALDYHCENGRGEQAALIYDSPVTNTKRTYSYNELRDEVALTAGMLRAQGVEPASQPFARYHSFGEVIDLEAGVIVAAPVQPAGEVKPGELPRGPAAIAVHTGSYETLGATHEAMRRWLEANPGQKPNGGPWELYVTDPATEPDPSRWMTEVIYPLKPNTEIG